MKNPTKPTNTGTSDNSELAGSCQFGVNDAGTPAKSDTELTRERSPDVHGWTYFLHLGDRIKIGMTAKPRTRIRQHRKTWPDLKILAIVPGSVAGEFETHHRFSHLRIDGAEMFRPEPDLLAFIRRAKKIGAKAAMMPPRAEKKNQVNPLIPPLIALRTKHMGNFAITFRASLLIEQIENLNRPDPPPLLVVCMAATTRELQQILAA
jgi:hypothetical protein